ncbi:hypothetical protein [Thermospira aquatica]|uniref:Uncharacterized protein n=1 Tax=Thermospira aquatica TaxID=2828656 RepID=A0AAX3BC92_9SPIR|nr:hypothetical protein [Thermospira aquatica]URA09899.1 hypothetical protein KDW03_10505 [Thermospira aquatica]
MAYEQSTKTLALLSARFGLDVIGSKYEEVAMAGAMFAMTGNPHGLYISGRSFKKDNSVGMKNKSRTTNEQKMRKIHESRLYLSKEVKNPLDLAEFFFVETVKWMLPKKDEPDWRPDEDRKLTLREAFYWFKNGKGEKLKVDIKSLNLGRVKLSDFNEQGKAEIHLESHPERGLDQALVYGTITLELVGSNQYKVRPDKYNFEMHNIFNGKRWDEMMRVLMRNVATAAARLIHTPFFGGESYPIVFEGTNTIGE